MRTYKIDLSVEVRVATGGMEAALGHLIQAFIDSFEKSHVDAEADAEAFEKENPGDHRVTVPRRLITNYDFDKIVRTDPKLEV